MSNTFIWCKLLNHEYRNEEDLHFIGLLKNIFGLAIMMIF